MAENMTEIELTRITQERDLLRLRLEETNTLIDDLLRKIARLRSENEALWEERGGHR